MTADPSRSVPPGPKARSVASAPAHDATTTSSALTPKNQPAIRMIGTRLPTTFHMMRGVESRPLRCGDAVTMSFFASIMPLPPLKPRLRRVA
jgi:hypothetical protein